MTIDESILITSTVLLVISLTTYFMSLLVMVVGIFVKHKWVDDLGNSDRGTGNYGSSGK